MELKFLIYEYLCGGGSLWQPFRTDILCEGYAMLRALIADLKMLGHHVITFLDSRIIAFDPPLQADKVIPISSNNNLYEKIRKMHGSVDAVYVIAPESGGILGKIVRDIEELGFVTINCNSKSIEKSSNKLNVYETLNRIGVAVPKTMPVNVQEDIRRIKSLAKELGFPLVFKPAVGAGSEGLSVVGREEEVDAAVKRVKSSSSDFFLIQQFVKGVPASVSLICDGKHALPLTLNAQLLKLDPSKSSLSYEGGMVPLHHPQEMEAFKVAQLTVECFEGLRGYVGVDLVLTNSGPVVMEVNPRLTTSYVGLRKVLDSNPAIAILNSIINSELPERADVSGYAFFFKVRVSSPKANALGHIYALEEVFSPPFPLNMEACALIVSSSEKLRDAKLRAYKVKRKLETICRIDENG
jgi:predicted ATP-grasp superfamily ATP-dependent carboligase